MGVTIDSKNCSIDLGYVGFRNLRTKIAELTAPDIYEHYRKLEQGMFLVGEMKDKFFKDYNAEIQKISKKYSGNKDYILDFLYASDYDGEMDADHCKSIYEIIKNYDDNICYGYYGRSDCTMFKDFKELVKDCIDTNVPITWS